MAQQRKTISSRQSDLQPVYDLLEALHPARLRRNWQRLDMRSRWLLIISVASLILVWVMLNLTSLMIRHTRATSGTFLFDALHAPYQLETRLLPVLPLDDTSMLPAAAGEYMLQPETVQVVRPAVAAAPSAAETEAVAAPVNAASRFITGQCLLSPPETDAPCLSSQWLYLTSGSYAKPDGTIINAAAASFASAAEGRQAMKDVHGYANQRSVMGNYALGIWPVDYFYSSFNGVYTFVWSHDNWIFTLSSTALEDMEKLIEAFPY